MYFNKTLCCAIQEICQLSQHPDAKSAMMDFCRLNWGKTEAPRYSWSAPNPGSRSILYSFYLFTCAVATKDGGGIYGSKSYDYGNNFRKFIEENNLGQVVGTPKAVNKAFHPDHSNQVFFWMPDQPALEAWWDKNKPEEKPVAPKPVVTVSVGGGMPIVGPVVVGPAIPLAPPREPSRFNRYYFERVDGIALRPCPRCKRDFQAGLNCLRLDSTADMNIAGIKPGELNYICEPCFNELEPAVKAEKLKAAKVA